MTPASRRARRPGNKFGLLLLVLVASYLLSAFATGTWVSVVQVALFLGIAALAVRTAHIERRLGLLAIITATGGSALVGALVLADPTATVLGLANIWKMLVLAFTVVLIVIRVLAQREVTLQSIYGALSAYMILGLMFAACYQAIDLFSGGGFFANGATGNLQTFQYFSFTTLTTLGYGDFTAAQNGGRAIAVMEAMVGQVFLATLVARLVSAFRAPGRSRAGRPGRSPRPPGPAGSSRRRAAGARPDVRARPERRPGSSPRAR
jgi:hypothetical protein